MCPQIFPDKIQNRPKDVTIWLYYTFPSLNPFLSASYQHQPFQFVPCNSVPFIMCTFTNSRNFFNCLCGRNGFGVSVILCRQCLLGNSKLEWGIFCKGFFFLQSISRVEKESLANSAVNWDSGLDSQVRVQLKKTRQTRLEKPQRFVL